MKRTATLLLVLLAAPLWAQQRTTVNLPSSKVILEPVPGKPRRSGSFTARAVVSPDKRYVAFLQDGYGSNDVGITQSIAVLDVAKDELSQYPDRRMRYNAAQSFFEGLAFSVDGRRLFASVVSITDPTGRKQGHLGNGIAVYSFTDGKVAPETFFPVAPQRLAEGKKAARIAPKSIPPGTQVPYPAGLAVTTVNGREVLLVCDDYSDDLLMLDASNGAVLHRFDLSTNDWVPAAFPYAVVANKEGTRAWVSLWNASQVVELDLSSGTVTARTSLLKEKAPVAAGSHPSALLLNPEGTWLYVALANRDLVAEIDTRDNGITRYLGSRQANTGFTLGEYPTALAQSADGKTLFVADASSDAVGIFEVAGAAVFHSPRRADTSLAAMGFIPTEWYPTALAVVGNDLIVAASKSTGTGPNSIVAQEPTRNSIKPHPYIPTLLNSSIARISIPEAMKNLPQLTKEVAESNLMSGRAGQIKFQNGVCGEGQPAANCPIKHVIYIIKENRTYDQIFGDLGVGNGDPSLTMYGAAITPNEHKLALQFGVIDNFYDSGEVSGDGHLWSNAAITSDYNERTWQVNYTRGQHTYDYEGMVANENPLEQNQPNPTDPATGYIWDLAARNKRTYRIYGEHAITSWCDGGPSDPWLGSPDPGDNCPATKYLKKGDAIPAVLQFHGEPATSEWPWLVPVVAHNSPTTPELRDHISPLFGHFRLEFPDQLRVNVFLNEFEGWVKARNRGRDEMPQLIVAQMPNDHTNALTPGKGAPDALVADNDLAIGRLVEAVSHSPYWDDTAIFILEDDAQDGVDHVDAHRSTALVISKYAPANEGKPAIDSHFYTTVNLIRTMEVLLGLPPMNNNDAHAAVMAPLFAGPGTQAPFTADTSNRENGRIYKANPEKGLGAAESAKLDFSHADAANTAVLNRILWHAAMGRVKMPPPQHTVFPDSIGDDDK